MDEIEKFKKEMLDKLIKREEDQTKLEDFKKEK